MKPVILSILCALSATALAHPDSPPADAGKAMDMTKMGPLSRKVTHADPHAIDALYKAMDEAWMKGDLNAVADLNDFPIYMGTDNAMGDYAGSEWSREQFLKIMGGMASMPKDMTTKHKLTASFLSDTLVLVIDDATMMKGKTTLGSFKTSNLVIKKNGKWLFKGGFEAGWGDVPMEPPAGSATKM